MKTLLNIAVTGVLLSLMLLGAWAFIEIRWEWTLNFIAIRLLILSVMVAMVTCVIETWRSL